MHHTTGVHVLPRVALIPKHNEQSQPYDCCHSLTVLQATAQHTIVSLQMQGTAKFV